MKMKIDGYEVEIWEIEKVKPYFNNPRKNDLAIEQVAVSLKAYGWQQPIVVDVDGVIVAGHTRHKAALKLQYTKVPIHIAKELTPAQIKAYRIMDNKSADYSEWDEERLSAEIEELKDAGYDIDLTGFSADELGDLLKTGNDGKTNPEEVPATPTTPKSEAGKVYQLGKHRLICGDSTKKEDVEKLMNGERASICFTSPPYNAGDNSLGNSKTLTESKYVISDERTNDDYRNLLIGFTENALQFSDTVAINIQSLAGNKIAVIEWAHHFKDHFVDRMIWFKGQGQPAMAANVMNSRFEDIWVFSPKENPPRTIPTGSFHGTISNVYEGRGASGENESAKIHAATMPIHLALYVIGSFDSTSGAVFEPFCGTGTTMIAAEKLGKKCFGVELVPLYCDVIRKRWAEFVHGENCDWEKLTQEAV